MIGGIYGDSVDADSVFPGFYQLLTWTGGAYIASDSFDPGVGYWALVLEETYINIPPPSESITILYDPFSRAR
jgi:hypothetical protein